MMRESEKVKDGHLQLQVKNLEAQFTEVKEQFKAQFKEQERQSANDL